MFGALFPFLRCNEHQIGLRFQSRYIFFICNKITSVVCAVAFFLGATFLKEWQ